MRKRFNLAGLKDWVVFHTASDDGEPTRLSKRESLTRDWAGDIRENLNKSALNLGWFTYSGMGDEVNLSTGPIFGLSSASAKDAVEKINDIFGFSYFTTVVSDVPSRAAEESSILVASIPVHKRANVARTLADNKDALLKICASIIESMPFDPDGSNEFGVLEQ